MERITMEELKEKIEEMKDEEFIIEVPLNGGEEYARE